MPKILVLDNYDSFTFNLVHIIRELGYGDQMDVFRNDRIELGAVDAYEKVLLSPGPGLPEEAGIMPELIRQYASTKHILGVCLGHQAIAEGFGARLYNLKEVLHGVATPTKIDITEDPLFDGLPAIFQVARYHSWAVDPTSINGKLSVLAVDDQACIMAIKHKEYPVYGVQFHPESVITEHGIRLMKNWLEM
ncbi:MAG: aminodeoxychorismate/anthranilate synthase component II [Bacteroidota bacterium]